MEARQRPLFDDDDRPSLPLMAAPARSRGRAPSPACFLREGVRRLGFESTRDHAMHSYLIYRTSKRCPLTFDIDWANPTGGIVSEEGDLRVIREVAEARYHCGPGERLIILELLDDPQAAYRALVLQLAWEIDCRKFAEWMEGEPA